MEYERKIQLTMKINFVSSLPDSNKTHIVHAKSDNVEIMMGSETNKIFEELFKSIGQRYQESLQKESMKESEFIFDSVDASYYEFNKVSLSRGGSYIGSLKWLKNKKASINPQNEKDDRCFQYALTVALNYKQVKKYPQRITKIKPFINQYDWKKINFRSRKEGSKNFELSNKLIALNILYVPYNTKEIRHAYKLKYNLKRENQVILLMITAGEKLMPCRKRFVCIA